MRATTGPRCKRAIMFDSFGGGLAPLWRFRRWDGSEAVYSIASRSTFPDHMAALFDAAQAAPDTWIEFPND